MTAQPSAGPTLTIREARPDEYEAVGEIGVRAYSALEAESDVGYLDEVRDAAARAAAATVLVAVEPDGRLLGTVTYVPGSGSAFAELQGDDEAGFRVLAVAPWAQGRGVGGALVEAVLARARDDGRAGVAIYTRPSMRAAHHLYEAFGFRRDPARDWEFERGEWLWAYELRF